MSPEISVVDGSHYSELSQFLASFPEDESSEAAWLLRLGHWWERNPTFSEDFPRGWVVRADAGAIVGFLGNIPRLFRSRGKDQRVFCATTWRVLPPHRHSSLRLYAAHVAAGKRSLLFNTTANASAATVLDYLKYQSLPKSGSGRAFLLPLNAARVARSYLSGRGRLVSLSGLGLLALRAASLPADLRLARDRDRRARCVERPGPEFDALWLRTQDEVTNTSVRTANHIQWMCSGGGRRPRVVVGVFAGDTLDAYAVFRHAQRGDLRILVLVDLWPTSASRATVGCLLAEAVNRARQDEYDMLVLHDYGDRLASVFRRSGLVLTTANSSRIHFRSVDQPPLTQRDSYLTDFDGDTAL